MTDVFTVSGRQGEQAIEEHLPLSFYEALMTGLDRSLTLAGLINRPAWMERAACRGRHDIDWQDPDPCPETLAICHSCPVLDPCTVYALRQRETGTWGGMGERARLGRHHASLSPRKRL